MHCNYYLIINYVRLKYDSFLKILYFINFICLPLSNVYNVLIYSLKKFL